ncbi:MAG TPA: DUF6152 family protein [Gammaproteobacteria bacterium]|jgi:hypothetical protein
MLRCALSGVAAFAAVMAAAPAAAHHSVAAEFDTSLQGELEGDITQVWFTNPHVRYRLTVPKSDGTTEDWELQAGNVTTLLRQNWSADSLKVGDHITVAGDLGRAGAKKVRIREIAFADGRVLPQRGGPQTDRNTIYASADKDYTYSTRHEPYPIDITGAWRNDYKWHVTVDDLEPKPTPFTAEGRQIFAATEPWHDYALRCMAMGLPRVFGAPYNMAITDAGSHYLMLYLEHNTPRRVWMDGRTAPPTTPATPMGFSVGHWEGDELVVETTHLMAGWLDGSGLPMQGGGTRIVERYVFSDDRLSVARTMTIYDPYYTAPLVRQRFSARGDDLDLTEQAPCDPDSYYRDLEASGRLEEHLNR